MCRSFKRECWGDKRILTRNESPLNSTTQSKTNFTPSAEPENHWLHANLQQVARSPIMVNDNDNSLASKQTEGKVALKRTLFLTYRNAVFALTYMLSTKINNTQIAS